MILITQLAGIVQSRVASIASGNGASVLALQNSWLIFMLPHSVIAVSIATAYFTRMSAHAHAKDLAGLRADLSASLRSIGLLIVFAAVALSVVAYPFARFFTATGFTDVRSMGNVILAFMPGLILFSILFVLQRVFYALGDTRTPFFMQCVQSALFVGGALACILLPTEWIGVGIATVTSIAGSAQAIVAIVLVRRRIGGVGGRIVLVRYLQYLGISLPSGVIGVVLLSVLGGFSAEGFAQSGRLPAIIVIAIVGAVMAGVYLALLAVIRNPELISVMSTVRGRFRRAR